MKLPLRGFFSTLRLRITLLHIAVYGVTLLTFSAVLYVIYERNQTADFDRFLYKRALRIARSISINAEGKIEINQALIDATGRLFPFQTGSEYIQIRSPDGRKVIGWSNNLRQNSLPLDPDLLAQLQTGRPGYTTLTRKDDPRVFWGEGNLRIFSMPLIAHGQTQIVLQLGVSTHALDQSLSRLRALLFFVGVPATLLLAGAGGWWLAGHAFQPINRIVTAAQKLGAERLEDRLPIPEVDDELRRLSLTLNAMLDGLEKAFKSQQRFIADASHELKTPLTILRGELDVLRHQPRKVEEYRAFLASASEELQRLDQIIQNLLLLARADSGRPLELKENVRLDEITLEAIERLQSFARQAQVKVSVTVDPSSNGAGDTATAVPGATENADDPDRDFLSVRGDADLLASLFFNLIHNAIKHSSAGQTVAIRLQPVPDGTRVSVRDLGAGIAAEDLPHIFERFYRAENPSRRTTTGTGLGLAIAQWIAGAHGAQILVESKPADGSVFSVTFQKSPPSTSA